MAYYSDYCRNQDMEDMYLNQPAPHTDTPMQAANRLGVALTMSLVPTNEVPFGQERARLTSILLGKNGSVLRAQVREVYCPAGPAIVAANPHYF